MYDYYIYFYGAALKPNQHPQVHQHLLNESLKDENEGSLYWSGGPYDEVVAGIGLELGTVEPGINSPPRSRPAPDEIQRVADFIASLPQHIRNALPKPKVHVIMCQS